MNQQTTQNPPIHKDHGQGCYYIRLFRSNVEKGIDFYHGTLRIESLEDMRQASCDLYTHSSGEPRPECSFGQPDAIPVFPRDKYSCHLEIAQIREAVHDDVSFQIRFKLLVFDHKTASLESKGYRRLLLTKSEPPNGFQNTQFGERFYAGEMKREDGVFEGTIFMGRVSKDYFRRASLEIDCIPGCPAPVDNGSGKGWKDVFRDMGWKLDTLSIEDVPSEEVKKLNPNENKTWTTGQLHEAMQRFRRPSTDLDHSWHYHIMVVPRIAGYGRGVMYDVEQNDPNSPPREGAALASEYYFPGKDDDSKKTREGKFWQWTAYAGECFSEIAPLYFRTAVHELGHLLGLGHNQGDDGFMNATNIVALNMPLQRAANLTREWGQACIELHALTKGIKEFRLISDEDFKVMEQMGDETMAKQHNNPHFRQEYIANRELRKNLILKTHEAEDQFKELIESIRMFPDNIQWRFNEKDLQFLRHGPDAAVRPGSRCHSDNLKHADSEISELAEGYQLYLDPQQPSFPIGAPVRFTYRLLNVTHRTSNPKWLPAPENLSFKTGNIKIRVTAPNGSPQEVTPLLLADDEDEIPTALGPGSSRSHSLTLFTAGNQCLFKSAGEYTIDIRIHWKPQGKTSDAYGHSASLYMEHSTSVHITPPIHAAHQEEANRFIRQTEQNQIPAFRGSIEKSEHSSKTNMEYLPNDSVLLPHYRAGMAKDYFEHQVYQSRQGDFSALSKALGNITENMVLTPVELGKMLDIVEYATSYKEIEQLTQKARSILIAHARRFRTTKLGSSDDAFARELLQRFQLTAPLFP